MFARIGNEKACAPTEPLSTFRMQVLLTIEISPSMLGEKKNTEQLTLAIFLGHEKAELTKLFYEHYTYSCIEGIVLR